MRKLFPKLFLALSLLTVAGCGNSLASPRGPVFAFNPSQWQPEPGDLAVPSRPAP